MNSEIEFLKRQLKIRNMDTTHPTWSLNRYDEDGSPYDKGIFLNFGHTIIKVGESIEDLDTLIVQLGKCRAQVNERKHELSFDFKDDY